MPFLSEVTAWRMKTSAAAVGFGVGRLNPLWGLHEACTLIGPSNNWALKCAGHRDPKLGLI